MRYPSTVMTRSRRARIVMLATAVGALGVVLIVPGLEVGVLFLSPAIILAVGPPPDRPAAR
jgi:uncharacterized membrane protein